jgi:hypothetical protein
MRIEGSIIPENVLRKMSKEDRKQFGKAGLTFEEACERAALKSEKDLQTVCLNYLSLKAIPYCAPQFGKKTRIPEGWPDVTFPHPKDGRFCAVEFKHGSNHTTPEQARTLQRIEAAGGIAVVVRTFEQFLALLK